VRCGNLATAVIALELVLADGSLRRFARGDEDFPGAVVHVGSLGACVSVTLQLVPAFRVAQHVYEGLALEEACTHFDDIMSAGYSVSLFTTWAGDTFEQVWRKVRVEEGADGDSASAAALPGTWHGAARATGPHHPLPGADTEPCTEQLGIPGPWHARLPHFRAEFTPSHGDELQTECVGGVDLPLAPQPSRALTLTAQLRPAPQVLCSAGRRARCAARPVRAQGPHRASAVRGRGLTWRPLSEAVMALLPAIESALAPFGARPHWGKLFVMDAATLAQRYERLPAFAALARRLDPTGKFSNAFSAGTGVTAPVASAEAAAGGAGST